MEEFSLRVYRMLRSVSTAISRIGLGLAKRPDQKDGYKELQPLLASLCMYMERYGAVLLAILGVAKHSLTCLAHHPPVPLARGMELWRLQGSHCKEEAERLCKASASHLVHALLAPGVPVAVDDLIDTPVLTARKDAPVGRRSHTDHGDAVGAAGVCRQRLHEELAHGVPPLIRREA